MSIHALRLQERLDRFEAEYEIRTDGQIHLGPINLDAMPDSDLEFAAEHGALHNEVRKYAKFAREARKLRQAGEIRKAQWIEAKCEQLYQYDIPESCRW